MRDLGILALAATIAAGVAPNGARAYEDGLIGSDCSGCHGVGDQTVELQTTPGIIDPSAVVAFTVTMRAPDAAVAGVNVTVDQGMLRPVGGGGLKTVGVELTHTMPMPVRSGVAEFRGEWVAPAEIGAVRFVVSTVAGNGDGRRGAGDGGAVHVFDRVFGCESATFYRDADGDGHGAPGRTRIGCAMMAPERHVESDDDCDDLRATTYAGADELCNRRDDDCDGSVDENIEPAVHYPDADGDGYYSGAERESGETIAGCPESGRWASLGGDCAPDDPAINPGEPEVCNLVDDNCDGREDERVRPQCGVGWCRRDAWSCNAEDCEPGEPTEERCNLFDEDCDGLVDEDSCPVGEVCSDFECVAEGTPSPSPSPDAGAGPPGGGAAGGCSASSAPIPLAGAAMAWLVAVWLARRRRR